MKENEKQLEEKMIHESFSAFINSRFILKDTYPFLCLEQTHTPFLKD